MNSFRGGRLSGSPSIPAFRNSWEERERETNEQTSGDCGFVCLFLLSCSRFFPPQSVHLSFLSLALTLSTYHDRQGASGGYGGPEVLLGHLNDNLEVVPGKKKKRSGGEEKK